MHFSFKESVPKGLRVSKYLQCVSTSVRVDVPFHVASCQWPLLSKRPQSPEQIEFVLVPLIQSSSVYWSGEYPGTSNMSPSQCSFPGCSMTALTETHHQFLGLIGTVLWWSCGEVQQENKEEVFIKTEAHKKHSSLVKIQWNSWKITYIFIYMSIHWVGTILYYLINPLLNTVKLGKQLFSLWTAEIKDRYSFHTTSNAFPNRSWCVGLRRDWQITWFLIDYHNSRRKLFSLYSDWCWI